MKEERKPCLHTHVKWFYGQLERAYYLNYFIKLNKASQKLWETLVPAFGLRMLWVTNASFDQSLKCYFKFLNKNVSFLRKEIE